MKIVAIGGGEIGRPGYPVETTEIDREILKLTGKRQPKLLFIPTASSDSDGYIRVVHEHFGNRLGCLVSELKLLKEQDSRNEVEKKIFEADVVYVGGGNTAKMMKTWRKYGIGDLLYKAAQNGTVLSGISAGAICWFKFGSSDSRRFTNPQADLIRVSGLGVVSALYCPHFDVEKDREADLERLMVRTPGVAFAVDNCCALEITDTELRVISSKETAQAYRVFWEKGEYHKERLKKNVTYPLQELCLKSWRIPTPQLQDHES